jgi:hypothetical protein
MFFQEATAVNTCQEAAYVEEVDKLFWQFQWWNVLPAQ